MSTPDETPQPPQPGTQPPQPGNVPPAGYQPPQGYQPPSQQGYQPPSQQGYQPPSQQGYQPPPTHQQPGQPSYAPPVGPNPAPPSGLGYSAPPRNVFGLDFNNIGQRLRDTTGVPNTLTTSYWLWIAAAALGVVANLANIFIYRDIFGALAIGTGIFNFVFSLLMAAVYIFIAIRLKEGARWARLVLSILGGFAVLSLLFLLFTLNLGLLSSAAAVAAAVMMWLPESQKHFA
ncbi:hypothetical protein [Paenarthrobacter nitroguajacolicus]|uniref:hypothetical protein n=1 Tax=Paenarthrobacter nitroguajacolicus TaxID=211146 RepID=UPI004053B634